MKSSFNVLQFLCQNYGLGVKSSRFVCKELGLLEKSCSSQLTDYQLILLGSWLEDNFKNELGNQLVQKKIQNIKLKIQIREYVGVRHFLKLPCRGQRTHSNAKTVKKVKLCVK